jgi:hypothetical protein
LLIAAVNGADQAASRKTQLTAPSAAKKTGIKPAFYDQ